MIAVRSKRLQLGLLLMVPLAYMLSSGPTLATAFWLRDLTGWDGFYAAMWLYYPLGAMTGHSFDPYIGWWIQLIGSTPPG
jgi:hypothetical protein